MGDSWGRGLCPLSPGGDPGPLSTPYLPAQCAEGLKGEKGESGALVSMRPGPGQGSRVMASLPILSSPLLCVPFSSQGPSGLPGSTGQKVMGLDSEGMGTREVCKPYRQEEGGVQSHPTG